MDNIKIVLTLISVLSSISAILFAFLAFKRNSKGDKKQEGKDEGVLISDIKYLKSSIEKLEQSLEKLELKNDDLLYKIIKLEQRIDNNIRNDSISKKEE